MSEAEIRKYWDELNEMYGTEIEMPAEMVLEMSETKRLLAMGYSFDAAMQSNMD